MKVGFHVSIANGIDKSVDRAQQLGCTTFQIFTRNPRMWKYRKISDHEIINFKNKLISTGIRPIFSHMPYLPNLCSPKKEIYEKSLKSLEIEILRCNKLDVRYIVTHIGSHLGTGYEEGVNRVVNALDVISEKYIHRPMILLENTSGKKNEIGSTFNELNDILSITKNKFTGICFDTCHAHSRGYDFSTKSGVNKIIKEIKMTFGFNKLKLIHLNDTKDTRGSRKDRHEHIGLGLIGEEGFRNILNSKFITKPLIMETPINEIRTDIENMKKLNELIIHI